MADDHNQAFISEIGKELERLRADNAKLRAALETLMDEQNGPPLIRDAAHWHAAMAVGCDAVGRNVSANYHRMKSDELFAKEDAK